MREDDTMGSQRVAYKIAALLFKTHEALSTV